MTYLYVLEATKQVRKSNGYGYVWSQYTTDGPTITLRATGYEEASETAESLLPKLAQDYRYHFSTVSITEIEETP